MHISPESRPPPTTLVQASALLKKHLGSADSRFATLMGIDMPPRKSEKSKEKSTSRQSERSGGSEKSEKSKEKSISRQSERSGGSEKSEKSISRQSERSGGLEKSDKSKEKSISRKSEKK